MAVITVAVAADAVTAEITTAVVAITTATAVAGVATGRAETVAAVTTVATTVANNHNCGYIDSYYAAQYCLNTNCCGRDDWFSYHTSGCGCNRF